MTKSTNNNTAATSTPSIDTNSNAAVDISTIEFTKMGQRAKGSDVLEFFAEKVLAATPEKIELVIVKGAPNLIFTKLNNKVRVHMIKQNGLSVSTHEVKGPQLKEIKKTATPKSFLPVPKVKKSTKKADRSVFDDDGVTVLRRAPIGKTTPQYIYELEVLANEFTEMDPRANFGIHFRAAISKGVPKHIMMTVYTAGSEKAKAASAKGVKINFLGNADMIEEWLEKVQSIYNDCAERLLRGNIVHETGFKFNRRAFVENNELIVTDMKSYTLDKAALALLARIVKTGEGETK